MANGFGYTFSPSGRNRLREQNGEQGSPQGSRELGRALQVLSLRLPRVTGGSPIAPDDLLRSMGGPGPVGVPEPPAPSPVAPAGPPAGPGMPSPPPVAAAAPAPSIPPLMAPPAGSAGAPLAPLQTLVNKAGTGIGAAPKKKKTTVRGGVPSKAAPTTTAPKIIPGIGGGTPEVDDPLGQANDPFVPVVDTGAVAPQSQARARWADKYEMDPSMFNNFLQ